MALLRGNPNWAKGQSANPGGRPKGVAEVIELARKHTAEAIAGLAKIAKTSKHDSARVAAWTILLDRAWGKAPAFVTSDADAFRNALDLSDDELATIANIAARSGPRADPPPDDPEVVH